MLELDYTDKYFDKNLTSLYHLSIQLLPDGFSFCIRDTVRNKFIRFFEKRIEISDDLPYEYYCQHFYDFLMSQEILNSSFKKVSVLYHTTHSTLVPISVYDPGKLKELFQMNFPDVSNEDIFSNRLKNSDAAVVFAVPECINKILSQQYSNYKIYHQGYALIDNSLFMNKGMTSTQISVNIGNGILDVCLINTAELLLYNNFSYTTENDIVYHIANICDQFSKEARPQEISLAGNILEFKALIANLERYFKRVNSWKALDDVKFSDSFLPLSLNKYSNLFSLYKCE
jgi:hypothetical protein